MTITRNAMTAVGAVIATLALVLVFVFVPTTSAKATNGDEPCVPQEAYTETVVVTPEQVIEHEAVTHEEEQRVGWIRYSWTGGPHTSDSAPVEVPPHDNWQENTHSDPHGVGVEGPYFRSNGNSGNGDWFYLLGVYETVTVVDEEAWTETIPAVTEEVFHPAVTCPETPTETPTVTPETPVVTNTPVPCGAEGGTSEDCATPEVPEETPVGNPNPTPTPEENPPVKNPPKNVQVIECVDGVFVTTVNGEVISESGSCVERDENETPVTFSETGL